MGNSHNFNEYRRTKEEWHWLVKAALTKVQRPKMPFTKAKVRICYYFKNAIRRDPDNYSGKMILDPLVKMGVLADDSFEVVTLEVLKGGVDKLHPRCEVEIIDLN